MRTLLSVLVLIVISSASGAGAADSASTYPAPAAIASDCSVDVTQPILTWIASVPDNSILSFPSGACYRIEGTLDVTNRNGLDIQGNGAIFKATTTNAVSWRSQWRVNGGSHISFRNMTIRGANPTPGSFVASFQGQHAIDLRGTTAVEIDHVSMASTYGDCIMVGRPADGSGSWSSGVHVHDSICTGAGRNGVLVAAGRDVLVETSHFSVIGLNAFDIEPDDAESGADNITLTRNEIGAVSASVFAAMGHGPVDNVTVSYNTVVGRGMYLAALAPTGRRYSGITIIGNVSDTGYYSAGSVAMDFVRVDGLTVTGNTIPLSGPNMALAAAWESCDINVAGNSYPGGLVESRIYPYDCGQQPAPTISSFTPSSGPVGTKRHDHRHELHRRDSRRVQRQTRHLHRQLRHADPGDGPRGATTRLAHRHDAGRHGDQREQLHRHCADARRRSPPSLRRVARWDQRHDQRHELHRRDSRGSTGPRHLHRQLRPRRSNDGPAGATSGRDVTTPGGTATSASNFTVTRRAAPTISSFTPSSGPVGTKRHDHRHELHRRDSRRVQRQTQPPSPSTPARRSQRRSQAAQPAARSPSPHPAALARAVSASASRLGRRRRRRTRRSADASLA